MCNVKQLEPEQPQEQTTPEQPKNNTQKTNAKTRETWHIKIKGSTKTPKRIAIRDSFSFLLHGGAAPSRAGAQQPQTEPH